MKKIHISTQSDLREVTGLLADAVAELGSCSIIINSTQVFLSHCLISGINYSPSDILLHIVVPLVPTSQYQCQNQQPERTNLNGVF